MDSPEGILPVSSGFFFVFVFGIKSFGDGGGLKEHKAIILTCQPRSDPNIYVLYIVCKQFKYGVITTHSEPTVVCSIRNSKLFPRAKIVLSCLLPRMVWLYTQNFKAMEKAQARLNREANRLVSD